MNYFYFKLNYFWYKIHEMDERDILENMSEWEAKMERERMAKMVNYKETRVQQRAPWLKWQQPSSVKLSKLFILIYSLINKIKSIRQHASGVVKETYQDMALTLNLPRQIRACRTDRRLSSCTSGTHWQQHFLSSS